MNALLNYPRVYKKVLALCTDVIFLPIVFLFAIWLRYDGISFASEITAYIWLITLAPVVAIPIFIKLGLYRAVIRFIDHKIVYVVVFGVSFSVLILLAVAIFINHMQGLSRGVFGIYWVSAILYVLSSRFIARAFFHEQVVQWAGSV